MKEFLNIQKSVKDLNEFSLFLADFSNWNPHWGCLHVVLTLERLLSSGVLLLATHCGQLRRGEDLGEPHSLTRGHTSSSRSSKKDLRGCYVEALITASWSFVLPLRFLGCFVWSNKRKKTSWCHTNSLEDTRCCRRGRKRTFKAAMLRLFSQRPDLLSCR